MELPWIRCQAMNYPRLCRKGHIAAYNGKSLNVLLLRNQTPLNICTKIGMIYYIGDLNNYANFHYNWMDKGASHTWNVTTMWLFFLSMTEPNVALKCMHRRLNLRQGCVFLGLLMCSACIKGSTIPKPPKIYLKGHFQAKTKMLNFWMERDWRNMSTDLLYKREIAEANGDVTSGLLRPQWPKPLPINFWKITISSKTRNNCR